MKRLIRSMMLGGSAALALAAGTAQAHDLDHARQAPASARTAPVRLAHDRDGDRPAMRREYGELAAARERFYRGWHGDRIDRARFERWCSMRRAELDRRWSHERYRG